MSKILRNLSLAICLHAIEGCFRITRFFYIAIELLPIWMATSGQQISQEEEEEEDDTLVTMGLSL